MPALEGAVVEAIEQVMPGDLVLIPGEPGDWEVQAVDLERERVTLKSLTDASERARPPFGLRLAMAMSWKDRQYPPTWNPHLRKVPA